MPEAPIPDRPGYRPDIDGLRGLAVLAVVGFHAFPGLVKSGFIGVDIFFVISGFLITTIIVNALERGTFSFVEFYVRRIRRIFPALAIVLLAVLAIGWYVLASEEYKTTGLHVVGGSAFTSNFILWNESGYFDTLSERKALLHLWSLAIEEQFYLFFPFVLWAAHKRRVRLVLVASIVGFVSFAWNIFVAAGHPSMDFYSPQTRVWELMMGAVLAIVLLRAPNWLRSMQSETGYQLSLFSRFASKKDVDSTFKNLVSVIGIGLLGLGFVLIMKENRFPGWWALLPTLGAFMLIAAGASAWFNRSVLSNRALVWFGLISFPLYLWHWPLLSFAYVHTGGTPSRALKVAIVAVSIGLAWLTYRLIERPLRFGKKSGITALCLLALLIGIGIAGFVVYKSNGLKSRPIARKLDPYLATAKMVVGFGGCEPLAAHEWACKLGNQPGAPSAFVYGDSHAYSMRPALAKYAHETGHSILYTSIGGCPSLMGVYSADAQDPASLPCFERGQEIFEYVRDNHIPNVFLVARWTNYNNARIQSGERTQDASKNGSVADEGSTQALQDGLERTIDAYRKIGVHVYLFVDNPLQKYPPEDALRKSEGTDDSINAFSVTTSENASGQGWMAKLLSTYARESVTILDFTSVYCPEDICPLVKDEKFLYIDRDHLSTHGSLLIYPELKKILENNETLR